MSKSHFPLHLPLITSRDSTPPRHLLITMKGTSPLCHILSLSESSSPPCYLRIGRFLLCTARQSHVYFVFGDTLPLLSPDLFCAGVQYCHTSASRRRTMPSFSLRDAHTRARSLLSAFHGSEVGTRAWRARVFPVCESKLFLHFRAREFKEWCGMR